MIKNSMGEKRLSINLIVSIFSYCISAVLSFFLTPFIVNKLGTEIYGFYGIANNVVNFITIISIALNSMASKYITVELVKGNQEKALKYFSSVFFSNVALCLVLTPLLVLFVLNLQHVLIISNTYTFEVKILFSLVFAAMIIRFITSVFGSSTYATNRMDIKAYVDIIKTLLRLVLFIAIFTVFEPSIIYLGIVLFILEIFNSFSYFVLSKKLMPDMKISKKNFDKKLIGDTLKVGMWNSLNQLGDLLLSSSDLLIANIMLGELASGNISIIKTVPALISGIITAINIVFMPRLARLYGENDKEKMISEVKNSQFIMGTIITPAVVLFILCGKEFFSLWVPANDSDLLNKLSAIEVVRMVIIAVAWPVSNLNIVMDKVKIPSLFVLGSGFLNVVSMFFLIKFTQIGIYTIPLTTLVISALFYGVFIPIYSARILQISKIKFFIPIFKMVILFLILSLIFGFIKYFIVLDTWVKLFLFVAICGIVALIVSFMIMLGFKKFIILLGFKRRVDKT